MTFSTLPNGRGTVGNSSTFLASGLQLEIFRNTNIAQTLQQQQQSMACTVSLGGFLQFAPLSREWRQVTEHARERVVLTVRVFQKKPPKPYLKAVIGEIESWPTVELTVIDDTSIADAYRLAYTEQHTELLFKEFRMRYDTPERPGESSDERYHCSTPYVLKQNLRHHDSLEFDRTVLLRGSVLRPSYVSVRYRGEEIYRRQLCSAGPDRFITRPALRRLSAAQSVVLSTWKV